MMFALGRLVIVGTNKCHVASADTHEAGGIRYLV